jgi:hypothetical protein
VAFLVVVSLLPEDPGRSPRPYLEVLLNARERAVNEFQVGVDLDHAGASA